MDEETYKVRWKGVETGPFTALQIEEMVESRQLSGASQVNAASGWILVQDFLEQLSNQREMERDRAEKQAAATAAAERRRLEELRLEREQLRVQEDAERKRQQEEAERQTLADKASGKKYYLFLDGNKKGPFAADAVQVMVNSGKATSQTLVWTSEIDDWVALSGYPELLGSAPPPPAPPPQDHFSPGPAPMQQPYGGYEPYGGYTPNPYHQPMHQPEKGNGIATTALVFALVSLLIFPPIFGFVAFILGIIGICVCPNKGYAALALVLSIILPIVGMFIGIAVYQNL